MSNEPLAPGFPAGRGQAPNRDNEMVEFNCVCGTTTNTKKDGSPWKHQTPDGKRCEFNQRSVPDHESAGFNKVVDHTYADVIDNPEVSDLGLFETTVEEEVADVVDTRPVFSFEVNVYNNMRLLLEDAGWHNANKNMAALKARKAGKSPVGEARLAREDVFDRKVVLVYEVPVREG